VFWRTWFGRRRDDEIDEEIASHLAMAIRDRMEQGETPGEARRRALIEFGSPILAKETTRSVWTWTTVEQLVTDFQIGARILWRAPALSATAILLIALVIGGNLTVFSMVHAVLAKPAPGIVADRLVTLGWVADGQEHPASSYPNYVDVAAASHTLQAIVAQQFGRFVLTTPDGSYAIQGATVSTNYFDTLGIHPIQGRPFTESEGRPNASGLVAIISERLWRERFAGSPTIIGQTTLVNDHVATIVGIAPAAFHGVALSEASDVWMPFAAYAELDGQQRALTDRFAPTLFMIGRLAPDVSVSEAGAELATIARQLPRPPGDGVRNRTIQLFPYSATAAGDSLVAQRGPWFLALFSIITALTLLIVYGNVANLMLARSVGRAREMAVRQSLGASQARIVRIFVAEGLVIATAAWVAAAIIAFWTTRAIPGLIPPLDGNASRILFDFTPDWTVLGYAMLLALVGAVFISAGPGLRTYRQNLQPLLKAGEQGVIQGRSTISNGLVVLQLAFSVLLLTTAGLAYRSLSVLYASDLGLERGNLLLVSVNTKATASTKPVLDAMLERLRAVPGITAASYARRPIQSYWPSERILTGSGSQLIVAERDDVGPGYLRAMGVRPIAGEDFDERSDNRATATAVINQHLAAALWPGESAVGRTLLLGSSPKPVLITGVAPNAFYNGYRRESDPDFVLVSAALVPPSPQEMTLYVRYTGRRDDVVPAISRTLREVDERVPIVYLRTMDEQVEGLTWPIQALAILIGVFAVGSTLIATIGQYAAMAFTMRRRIRDFGVRIALGASSHEIVASAVREGLRLTVAGLAIGGGLSLFAATSLRSMLYGVTPTDMRTYIGVVALLSAASLIACYLPAHRAGRIDAMQALREE
jgi:predicted permease